MLSTTAEIVPSGLMAGDGVTGVFGIGAGRREWNPV
jgi:hypothetical protein